MSYLIVTSSSKGKKKRKLYSYLPIWRWENRDSGNGLHIIPWLIKVTCYLGRPQASLPFHYCSDVFSRCSLKKIKFYRISHNSFIFFILNKTDPPKSEKLKLPEIEALKNWCFRCVIANTQILFLFPSPTTLLVPELISVETVYEVTHVNGCFLS